MSLSFHQASVTAFTRTLTNLKAVLARAKTHAQEHKVDESVLVNARLYPDMFPLSRQVQIATDTARGVAARLSGTEPPAFEDTEQSFDELTTRINRTLDYLRTLDAKAFEGAETREITRPVRGNPHTFTGLNYLMQFGVPNVYFHTTTAYAILRHSGVPLGKWDYLGVMD